MKTKDSISVINNGTTINVDFGGMGIDNSVIFFDSTCVVTGKKGIVKMLVAEPGFHPQNLPVALRSKVFNIKEVNLCTGNPFEDQVNPKTELPGWLSKMSKLSYLRLEDIKNVNMAFLQNSKMKRLILIRTDFENRNTMLNDISKLVNLEYLVSNNLFTSNEIKFLKRMLPALVILNEREYNKKIESGVIAIP